MHLAANDQRTDSGIKTLETRKEQADYKKMVETSFLELTQRKEPIYEIYHWLKRITSCINSDKVCTGEIGKGISRAFF